MRPTISLLPPPRATGPTDIPPLNCRWPGPRPIQSPIVANAVNSNAPSRSCNRVERCGSATAIPASTNIEPARPTIQYGTPGAGGTSIQRMATAQMNAPKPMHKAATPARALPDSALTGTERGSGGFMTLCGPLLRPSIRPPAGAGSLHAIFERSGPTIGHRPPDNRVCAEEQRHQPAVRGLRPGPRHRLVQLRTSP